MVDDQSQVTIYPSKDIVTLGKRADGGWNLHNDETGATTWNVSEAEVERLIAYHKMAEVRDAEADIIRLALEISEAAEATRRSTKRDIAAKKAEAVAADVECVLPTTACSVADFVRLHGHEVTLIVETRYYEADPTQIDPSAMNDVRALGADIGFDLTEFVVPNRRAFGTMGPISVRARVPYTTDMSLPYPAVVGGTVGCGNKAESPRFLLRNGMLECNYQEFLRDAIAAGWEPQAA